MACVVRPVLPVHPNISARKYRLVARRLGRLGMMKTVSCCRMDQEGRAVGVDTQATGGAGNVRTVSIAVERIAIGHWCIRAGVSIAREVSAGDNFRSWESAGLDDGLLLPV